MTRYLISDTHFDHENIIKYENRPFNDINKMNEQMINSWNKIVTDSDVVIHIGDFAMANQDRVEEIISRLNGNILLLRGNHDQGTISEYTFPYPYVESMTTQHKGYKYYCCHNKKDIPSYWDNWRLIGHRHSDIPFINYNKKEINLSVEVIGYKPLPFNILNKCLQSMSNKSKNPNTIHDSKISDYQWYHNNHL